MKITESQLRQIVREGIKDSLRNLFGVKTKPRVDAVFWRDNKHIPGVATAWGARPPQLANDLDAKYRIDGDHVITAYGSDGTTYTYDIDEGEPRWRG